MASNFTSFDLPPLPTYTLKPLPPLLPFISDAHLALAAPIMGYWVVSLFFHIIDIYDLLPQYRLHTPAELLKRNRASQYEVLKDVILQHIIQTIAGLSLSFFDPESTYGSEDYDVSVWAQRIRITQRAIPVLCSLVGVNSAALGQKLGGSSSLIAGVFAGGVYPQLNQIVEFAGEQVLAPAFASWELQLAKFIYWIAVPVLQFCAAVVILDTWQYFLHRGMHMNHWLYTTLHSRHHRLYVPYAYGALYNHPVEGFTLDTLGSGIAHLLTRGTVRQSIVFFTFSSIKTVDDHCGYALPWDPLQHITSNNATYHDIHHQSWGIKSNFSQPFFTFWDRFFNTKWRGDTKLRYEKQRATADAWWEEQKRLALNQETASTTETREAATVNAQPFAKETPILLPSEASRVRRSPRKGNNSVQLKGLKERMVSSSAMPNGVPRVESSR